MWVKLQIFYFSPYPSVSEIDFDSVVKKRVVNEFCIKHRYFEKQG